MQKNPSKCPASGKLNMYSIFSNQCNIVSLVTPQSINPHATSRQLMSTIVTRQIRFVGHVVRKGKLKYLSLIGKVEGKRARGRQRLTFLGWLE